MSGTGTEEIKFGTSGLRGPASGFTDALVGAYVAAFLDSACADATSRTLAIGADLRASSPDIARRVARSARANGWTIVHGGAVPTPALAAYALSRGIPAIMVTGSHIPAQYNGLKFYTPHGELLKAHEGPIRERATGPAAGTAAPRPADAQDAAIDPGVAEFYRQRFVSAYPADALKGLTIGVFEHSAVGRDLLGLILEDLGADCRRFERYESFVAVDTEAVEPHFLALMAEKCRTEGLDAVVSTDGDGDRPLLVSEKGEQINGDILGALAAQVLGAQVIVTPLTSTTGLEGSGWFETITRTRIGSPYVVAAMAEAEAAGRTAIAGFEANGGFLTQTAFTPGKGALPALPTRDAVLPLIAALGLVRQRGVPLSALAATLPARFMRADRLQDIPPAASAALVSALATTDAARVELDARLAAPLAVDTTDGTRLTLADGTIVHFRPSGNAPELRCYVETDSEARTQAVLADMMASLRRYLADGQARG